MLSEYTGKVYIALGYTDLRRGIDGLAGIVQGQYVIVQFVVSLFFILLSAFIPAWVVVSICIIILGAATIGVIINDNARDTVEAMDEYHYSQTTYMKALYARVQNIAASSNDKALQEKLNAFGEAIKYSDSVSSPDLGSIENQLWNAIRELEQHVSSGDIVAAEVALTNAGVLLKQRNNLCVRYKKRSFNQGTPIDN